MVQFRKVTNFLLHRGIKYPRSLRKDPNENPQELILPMWGPDRYST